MNFHRYSKQLQGDAAGGRRTINGARRIRDDCIGKQDTVTEAIYGDGSFECRFLPPWNSEVSG